MFYSMGRVRSSPCGGTAAALLLVMLACLLPLQRGGAGVAAFTIQGTWSVANQVFAQRQKHTVVCSDTSIRLFGGRPVDSSLSWLTDVWEFNTVTNTWTEIFPAGSVAPRTALTVNSLNGQYYFFGGILQDSTVIDELVVLDTSEPPAGRWTSVTKTGLWPTPRTRHAAVTIPSRQSFVVFGGITDDKHLNEVWEFHVATGTWTRLLSNSNAATVPSGRFDPGCSLLDTTRIICFGGTSEAGDLDDTWILDVATATWTEWATIGTRPEARRLALTALWQGHFIVFGGYSSQLGTPVASTDVSALNLATGTWSHILQDAGLVSRDSGAMCSLDNGGAPYLMGGLNTQQRALNDVWRLAATFRFALISDNQAVPNARSAHVSVVLGDRIFIGLGVGSENQLLQDTWTFTFAQKVAVWTQKQSLPSHIAPRQGAAAVERGNSVFVFGGETSTGHSAELLNFEDNNGAHEGNWTLLEVRNTPPPARSYHGAAVNQRGEILILGGSTDTTSYASDLWVYDPATQKWSQAISSAFAGRRKFGFARVIGKVDSYLIVGGQKEDGVTSERWMLQVTDDGANTTNVATFTQLGAAPQTRALIRSEAAVVITGQHAFIIGGSISNSFPARHEDGFYHWSNHTQVNTHAEKPPLMTYASSAVYSGNSLFVFGGNVVSHALKRKTAFLNTMQIFEFNSAQMCGRSTAFDGSCIHCPTGSVNPGCTLAPQGTYQPIPYDVPVACPIGTHNPALGMRFLPGCRPCPGGMFNDVPGSAECKACWANASCPVGSSYPQSTGIDKEASATQPAEFDSSTKVPNWVFYLAGTAGGVSLLIATTSFLANRAVQNFRINYYIPVEFQKRIDFVYDAYVQGEGLDECTLVTVLRDLFKLEEYPAVTHGRLMELKTQRDEDGSNKIDCKELKLMITDLVEENALVIDGATQRTPNLCLSIVSAFRLRSLDYFSGKHSIGKVGDPIYMRKNTAGGATFILAVLLVVVVVFLLLSQYFYDNLVETRSMLPNAIITDYISANTVTIAVRTEGSATKMACVQNDTCIAANTVELTDSELAGFKPTTTCEWADPNVCTMTWVCKHCAFNKSSKILFNFGNTSWFSSRTLVEARFSSGVHAYDTGDEEDSASYNHFTPPHSSLVYKGYPGAIVHLELTPTYFSAPQSIVDTTTRTEGAGYHSLPVGVTEGKLVTAEQFNRFGGVPVTIDLQYAGTTLVVQREPKQSPLDLIATILGTVPGIIAGCVFGMQSVDFISARYRKYAQLDREARRKARREAALAKLQQKQAAEAEHPLDGTQIMKHEDIKDTKSEDEEEEWMNETFKRSETLLMTATETGDWAHPRFARYTKMLLQGGVHFPAATAMLQVLKELEQSKDSLLTPRTSRETTPGNNHVTPRALPASHGNGGALNVDLGSPKFGMPGMVNPEHDSPNAT